MNSKNDKSGLQVFLACVLILTAAWPLGSVARGELSPWLWKELELGSPRISSRADIAVEVFIYLALYALGYFVPYWIATFIFFTRRYDPSLGGSRVPPIPATHRKARIYIGLAGLTLYLLFLDSIMAFVRAVPVEIWNGWLLILGLALAAFFAFAAYVELTTQNEPPRNE